METKLIKDIDVAYGLGMWRRERKVSQGSGVGGGAQCGSG